MDRVFKEIDSKPHQSLERPLLPIIFLCDCSGSMAGSRVAGVNTATAKVLTALKDVASLYPQINWHFGLLSFANTAVWHLPPSSLTAVVWKPLVDTSGLTALGAAYRLLATYLGSIEEQAFPSLPPILLLLSDGMPTDDVATALEALAEKRLAQNALRFAIGIGQEIDARILQAWLNPWDQDKASSTHQTSQLALTNSAVELHERVMSFTMGAVDALLADVKHG